MLATARTGSEKPGATLGDEIPQFGGDAAEMPTTPEAQYGAEIAAE